MGFGFALYGKKSSEENRNLLKKERVYDKVKGKYSRSKTIYRFKSATPKQLEAIRDRIRSEERLRRQKLSILLLVLAVIISSMAVFMLF